MAVINNSNLLKFNIIDMKILILKIILITFLIHSILLAQNNPLGYPIFLYSETSRNFDHYDTLDIETTLYSYSESDTVLQVGDFYDYFSDIINYNDKTFFIKIIQKSKNTNEVTTQEYFRKSPNQWRKIKSNNEGTSICEVEVLETIVKTDTIPFCVAMQSGFASGFKIFHYKEAKESKKVYARKEKDD